MLFPLHALFFLFFVICSPIILHGNKKVKLFSSRLGTVFCRSTDQSSPSPALYKMIEALAGD